MIPIWGYIALGASVAGGLAGWALRDNIADADAGRAATALMTAKDEALAAVTISATRYEQWRAAQEPARIETRNTIREIFRDTPVPAECAAPDALVGLLVDKASIANAAAVGQSGATMPTDSEPSASAGRSRSR